MPRGPLTDKDREEIAEIRARIAMHNDASIKANGLANAAARELDYYQGKCSHPNKVFTSFMGDNGMHCPDCWLTT